MFRATSIVSYMGLLSLIIIISLGPADAVIAYDCSNTIRNMTTLSRLDIDDCSFNTEKVETSTEQIALLQLNEFNHIKIKQCKIEIERTIFNCGMSQPSSIVSNVFHSYIESISSEDCDNAVRSLSLKLKGIVISDLQLYHLNHRSLTFAGTIADDGACAGAHYEDIYGSWDNVVVTGKAIIVIKPEEARVNVEDDKVILPSGYRCKLSKGECIDPVGGYTFWDPLPKENCSRKTYTKIYEGAATKLVSDEEKMYTVNVKDTSFSFIVVGMQTSCEMTLLKTLSSNVFIVDSNSLKHLEKANIVEKASNNMDIFQYVNAKFVYVEKHIRSEVKSLFSDVMYHYCSTEKEHLANTLAIAATQPDEFALRFKEGPGYMAVMAGDVIHIIQCVPVEVTYDHVDKCYNRLPVVRGNDSMFLMPRTHILTKSANQVACNPVLLEHYKLEGSWYKLTPKLVEAPEPMKLKSSAQMTFQNIKNLVSSGIYRQEDLDSMRERIMFPIEQAPIIETLSQEFSNGMTEPVSIENSLSNYVMNKMFPDIWSIIWGPFSCFGTFASGVIGIFMIMKMIKFLFDIIINAYMLYTVHGWSLRLFGAFWISLANVSHLEAEKEQKENEEIEEKQENLKN